MGFDFRPLLDPDDQGEGSAQIKGIHADGAPHSFRLFYFEQTGSNGFPENSCITRELEGFTDGLSRPWIGPLVVVWDEDGVITAENLEEKAEEIVTQINNFYEHFVRDDGVPFDRGDEGDATDDDVE
ncbi:hypothetical protein VNI00_016055 [Paramarasmius palmivorus]|uniref:Uncharacterized protein n=1 Tax=Paramarasmius palmivorus TaxID=297713 RepID=A0AAW0BJF6_9AGAR